MSDEAGRDEPAREDADHDETALDDHDEITEPMASDTATSETTSDDEQSLRNNVERYIRYLLVAGLSLLALIALIRFYFAASATINTWISQDYRSLFQALFNLTILLLAGAGIAWQARKIR